MNTENIVNKVTSIPEPIARVALIIAIALIVISIIKSEIKLLIRLVILLVVLQLFAVFVPDAIINQYPLLGYLKFDFIGTFKDFFADFCNAITKYSSISKSLTGSN